MDKTIDRFLKFLMIIIVVWLFLYISMGRYEIVGTGGVVAYKLDKWTGNVSYLNPEKEVPLKKTR